MNFAHCAMYSMLACEWQYRSWGQRSVGKKDEETRPLVKPEVRPQGHKRSHIRRDGRGEIARKEDIKEREQRWKDTATGQQQRRWS